MHGVRVAGISLVVFGLLGGWPTGSDGVIGSLAEGDPRHLFITGAVLVAGVYAFIASFSETD